jgi:hypothetical protein
LNTLRWRGEFNQFNRNRMLAVACAVGLAASA